MSQAGRPLGKRHQEDVRTKIQASAIITRLMSAFDGTIELSQVQVNIGKTLLDKALPDLKSMELSGDVNVGFHEILTAARERAKT